MVLQVTAWTAVKRGCPCCSHNPSVRGLQAVVEHVVNSLVKLYVPVLIPLAAAKPECTTELECFGLFWSPEQKRPKSEPHPKYLQHFLKNKIGYFFLCQKPTGFLI